MSVDGAPFAAPTKIFQGPGTLDRLADVLDAAGVTRPVVVTDQGLVEARVAAEVVARLANTAGTWSSVPESPTGEAIEDAGEYAQGLDCDGVVAVGGGSCIDTAKAIAVLLAHGGPVERWFGADRVPGPCRPVVAIPTTAGSGSECNWHIAVLDSAAGVKKTIRSIHCCPVAAVLEPRLLRSLSAHQAAASGIDAVTHAIESFTSREADPLSDEIASGALSLAGRWLVPFIGDRENLEAAHGQLVAASLAGISVCHARTGLVHAMARPAVGRVGLPHGVCVALLLPEVAAFNLPSCREKYGRAARTLGLDPEPEALVEWLEDLSTVHVGFPSGYVQPDSDVCEELADEVMRDAGATERNARTPNRDDVARLYEASLRRT